MRLWHQAMWLNFNSQHLLGQHRECCALRGNGWKRPHATVDYVFEHEPIYLIAYHLLLIRLLEDEWGYSIDENWKDPHFRGYKCEPWKVEEIDEIKLESLMNSELIFEEHDEAYFDECTTNLRDKGYELVKGIWTLAS